MYPSHSIIITYVPRRKVSVVVSDGVEESSQQPLAEARSPRSPLPQVTSLVIVPSTKSSEQQQDTTMFALPPNNTFTSTFRNRRKILRERTWTSRFGVLRIRTYIHIYEVSSGPTPICVSTQTYCLEETEFRFTPSWGSVGFQLSTSYSNNQWIPASLRPSFIVPDSSKIFELCYDRHDNTSEVLKAFSEGKASPFDTNTRGETLLHVSIGH